MAGFGSVALPAKALPSSSQFQQCRMPLSGTCALRAPALFQPLSFRKFLLALAAISRLEID